MTSSTPTSIAKSMRSRRLYVPTTLVACAATMAISGCGNAPSDPIVSRVLLVDTAYLESPEIESARTVFKTSLKLPVAEGLEVVAFQVTVQAGTEDLLVQATHRNVNEPVQLVRINSSQPASAGFPAAAAAAIADHREILSNGGGVYWIEPAAQKDHYVLSVVLVHDPQNRFSAIRVSTTVIDEILVTGLEVELASEFFYFVVVGDSVQWGNGLDEPAKMSSLVIDTIENETGKTVIFQRYAHSGATIYQREGDGFCEFNCFGEAPKVSTAILDQVDQIIRPDLIDLVLTDGCINDVNVATIVNPKETPESIATLTTSMCRDGMIELLQKIRNVMPSAAVVVTGYYQIVGPQSDLLGLNAWLLAQGKAPSELEGDLIPALTANSISFLDVAHTGLREAISFVSSESPDAPPIAFADPQFTENNAIFAPHAWLWGMTADDALMESLGINLELAPMDSSRSKRIERCLAQDLDIGKLIVCVYASVGHPTPPGASAFANAIILQLRNMALLPAVD